MATPKKSSTRKVTRKSTGTKSAATKRTPKKAPAKKTTAAKKAPAAKKSTAKKKRKYAPSVGKKVGAVMDEMKAGKLRSGRSGKKVTDRKQAIAIGLSEARAEGKRVPENPNASKKRS